MISKPLHIGKASDLTGWDRALYRFFEMIPGFLAWVTILGAIIFSYLAPIWVAFFIIVFDFYWLLKTLYLSAHLRHNWKRMRGNLKIDWNERLKNFKYDHIYHMAIYPFYKEDSEVVEGTLQALADSKYDTKKIIVILASEERAGEQAQEVAQKAKERFQDTFFDFLITTHPADTPGEMAGKGSNIAYAAEEARINVLDKNGIDYKNVLVSAFDVDTVAYPQYLACLTWNFLTEERPYNVSFQPVPLFNNNIWQTSALSRVVASSGTFWQMIQQERPEKLSTFSSHSVSFQTLYNVGYWQKNMVSEDSRIYWNAFLAHAGDYKVKPISYPVSMDAPLAPSFFKTAVSVYKQQRRWGWGVENVPYILYNFVKDRKISLWKKIKVAFVQVEGFWSLATNPLIIFLLGWLPLVLGGNEFRTTILSYNLPIFTRNIMILAMSGLVVSAIISLSFLPPRPKNAKKYNWGIMLLQWILIPITITLFGAIPGLEAQTRLMIGKYMGFWPTPKHRK